MTLKLNVSISLAAGLLGGALSHSLWPRPVHAQEPTATVIGPAQSLRLPVFLVNESGAVVANFSMDADGQPNIKLLDAKSVAQEEDGAFNAPRVIWSARSGATLAKR